MAFTPLGQPVAPQPEEKGLYGKVSDTLGEFSAGVVKGGLSTLKGIGTLGQSALDQTVGRGVNAILGKGFTPTGPDGSGSDLYRKGTQTEQKARQFLTPEGTAQKVGFGTEQIAEFFVPATKIAKGEAVITALTSGLPKFLGGASRVAGKAGINALADTAIGAAQTGDLKEGAKIGLLGGGIRAGMGVVGELARAAKIPERLYQTVFKNASRDMMDEFKTDYLVDLYKNRPHIFNDLAEQGIIKVDGGVPVLNKTLAEEALGHGLKGSITSMGKQVTGDVLQNESKVRSIVQKYKGTVGLTEPEFFNVLREIANEYKGVGFGKISNEADALAKIWLDSQGKVDGNTALAIRRLLDKARLARSYDVPVSKLSLTQANLKIMADEARGRLNKIPGLKPVMDEYAFGLDALEALAKEGARRGNNQVLSLIDSVFLGAGMAAGDFKQAVTLAGLRKYLQSGRGATRIGSTLANPNASAKTVGVIGAGASLLAGEAPQPTAQSTPQYRKSFTPYTP